MIFLTKGVNDCKIVIPENAHIVEKTAAEELVNYIEKALSVKLSVVSENEASGKCIYVGHTEYAKDNNILGKSKENWIIKMVGGNLVLTGGEKRGERGIIYSVYHFLEDVVGVRWWNVYEEDVLVLNSLSFADDFHKEGTPHFHYRKPLMDSGIGVKGVAHLARTRTNVISPLDDGIPDGVYDETVRKYGDVLTMGRPHHVHTMGKFFPAEEYFDEHPEWWAWNRAHGKHLKEGHRCFSNEGFFNALLEKLMNIIKEDVELAEKTGVELPDFYSISMDDLMGYCFCECDECAKTLRESGYSGYVIKFINRLAREVKKVYPWVKIETLAYLEYIELPKDDTLPDENVIIRLADVYIDLARGIHSPTNKKYLKELSGWSELCAKAGCGLYIWDYHYNIQLKYPLPIFNRLKDTVKSFADYGVTGAFVETQTRSAYFWDLNKYLLCHLLEDPNADEGALIDDFMNRYYGKAGKYIKQYSELLCRKVNENIVTSMCCDEDSPFNYIDLETVLEGTKLLDKAAEETDGEAPFAARVNWLREPLDGVILCRYFDFKKIAEEKGVAFNFTTTELKARIEAAYNEFTENVYHAGFKAGAAREIAYFKSLPDEEQVFEIPEELRGVNKDDIYQFPMNQMVKFVLSIFEKGFGVTMVEDKEAATSRVMKMSYDAATGFRAPYTLIPTSKTADEKKSLIFELRQGDEIVASNNLYKEDIKHSGYHLYKVGSVSDIKKHPYTRLRIPQEVSVNLRGLAVNFPMDKCDVYVSMKFTGEIYGGKTSDENAIYFERVIVVRK